MRPRKLTALAVPMLAALTWLVAVSPAHATDQVDDVWCASGTECVAVGMSDSSGERAAQLLRWNGEGWSDEPEEAVSLDPDTMTSDLNGLHCTGATDCVAVGYATDEEGELGALVLRWDGTAWAEESPPELPEGALSPRLADVHCASSSSCVAVGKYFTTEVTAEGEVQLTHPLSIVWDGSEWTAQTVPEPGETPLSELTGVSCMTASNCVAVGSFVNENDVTKTMAVVWGGGAWSLESTPEPSEAELTQLLDASCRPSEACTAVGRYIQSGEEKTLALRRNTAGEWSIQSTPNPEGALARTLTGVSCSGGSHCTAVGTIERANKELPIVLAWSGTSWSQQAVETEALGAGAVTLAAIHCLSASECTAAGSVSYGRNAARRNLALRYDGSTWELTEEGTYDREWILDGVSESATELSAVSCPALHNCVAVGGLADDAGVERVQVGSWSGGPWDTEAGPSPSGSKASSLTGVSCTSSTACWAVGSYMDEADAQKPLGMRLEGSSWSLEALPSPTGALAGGFARIDCASASACVAVGSYVDEFNTQAAMIVSFDGSSWALETLQPPAESSIALADVACASQSSCLAVGTEVDPFGHAQGIAFEWNGSQWSALEAPTLAGNAPNHYRSVACSAVSECMVVGVYEDIGGSFRPLAFDWDGAEWQITEVPDPGDLDEGGISDVDCALESSCVAIAARPGSSSQPPAIFRWDGSEWKHEPPSQYPVGASAIRLQGVSCASQAECSAVGSAAYGGLNSRNLTLAYVSDTWFTMDSGGAGASLRGVSCISAEACVAVGDSTEPAGDPASAWTFDEDGWGIATASTAPGAYLTEVACLEAGDCLAVGRQGEWPFVPLAARFDGESWTTQSPPQPGGRAAELQAASCASSDWCVAVGLSWPAEGSGPTEVLAQSWNGTAWQTMSAPMPEAAEFALLRDVSCPSAGLCVAVGSYTDPEGVSHGLIERWDGSAWSAESLSAPAGQSYALSGIDCTPAGACSTVGTAIDALSGQTTALAARWSGSEWATEAVPQPQESSQTALADVDCYSSTRCVAAGWEDDAVGRSPLVAAWSDGAWALEDIPGMQASDRAALESVSCPSAADCTAVGDAQAPGGVRELLAARAEAEAIAEEAPTAAPSDPPITLTAEQQEAALALLDEDPAFQAAVGTTEYDVRAGSWTELDEEGNETLVGAYFAVTLKEPLSWAQRSWPATSYSTLDAHGYEHGQYTATQIEAAATEVTALDITMDLEFDEETHPVSGDAVEIQPLAVAGGEVDIDPEYIGAYSEEGAKY